MPNIPNRAMLHARLDDNSRTLRRLSNDGPFVRRFEAQLAAMTGAAHTVAMCNATVAMQVLFRALELVGEVIMPSFTFIATAHAAAWEQLQPVFVDVDPDTNMIAPDKISAALTPRTQAIVGVHLWGGTCDVDALQAIARRAGIPLIFDAAQALGCTYKGRPIGALGATSVLSFHATKVANCLEGGAVLTNDGDLAAKLRLIRNFGFYGYERVACLGTNAKLDEVSAAFGVGCLEDFDAFVAVNHRNLAQYQSCLADIPGLRFYRHDAAEKSNKQYVVLDIDPAACPLTRDELVDVLHAENILARKYFSPGCHRLPPYAAQWASVDTLSVTNRLSDQLMTLPTGTGISADDIDLIADRIRSALSEAACLRALAAGNHSATGTAV